MIVRLRRLLVGAFLGAVVAACPLIASEPAPAQTVVTYTTLADDATTSLLHAFYAGNGLWRDCPEQRCWVHNSDWGSDALTDTLYLRWLTTADPRMPRVLGKLASTARTYAPPCAGGERCRLWSDVPLWDAVADARESMAASGDGTLALAKAEAAFWAVEGSPVYALGACPAIRYQRPFGRGDRLKTLETDSNGIKAALLLFEATHDRRYLSVARARYAAVRRFFLDARVPLYTVYVFDDGTRCRQAAHKYFASVNGNMIWNGLALARLTGIAGYRAQALATARAVVRDLSDASGIFTDLQAENDVEEPLIEAMLDVAALRPGNFARRWIVRNAAAASSARRADGTFGRFFDGPPPASAVTAWQTNGGVAAEIAAASLEPSHAVKASTWTTATFVPHDIAHMPATIRFRGSGIAVIGTLGEHCCQAGYALVLVDGVETTNHIGMWQNKSSAGHSFPNSVLFAWRWPTAGFHSVTLLEGKYDAKQGGPFVHARGYDVLDRQRPVL